MTLKVYGMSASGNCYKNELPCGKLRGIERPNRKTSRGKPRGIEPGEIEELSSPG